MGGYGSGCWERYDRKATVEESLTLAMWDFRGLIYPESSGNFSWACRGRHKGQVAFSITCHDAPTITLRYRSRGNEVVILIPLQTTPTQFGGQRWWFTCPLFVDGEACDRRVGKLHLPPGARHFGCRVCHDLTYRSCQEAHYMDRLPSRIEQMEQRLEAIRQQQRA